MTRARFTYGHYASILLKLKEAPFEIVPVKHYVKERKNTSNVIILRHDVDRKPFQAIRMARLEATLGVRSSYYFRSSREGQFDERAIELIADLGHEVGYHYENLSQWRGNAPAALNHFAENLKRFRRIRPCETVCAHGKPLSRHNNFTQMLGRDFSEYGLLGDASLSLADDELVYFTDTGGHWNVEPTFNYRDYVKYNQDIDPNTSPSNTEKLISFLRGYSGSIYISTHPERWAHSRAFLLRARTRDAVINSIKLGLRIAGLR